MMGQLKDQFNLLRLLCNTHVMISEFSNKVGLVIKWISNKVSKPLYSSMEI